MIWGIAMSNDPKEFELDPALEAELEAMFAEARDDAPSPSNDLLARIEAQALAEQPAPVQVVAPAPAKARGWFDWHMGVGGWSSLGGLTAALVVGFGIGFSSPDTLTTLTPSFLSTDTSELDDVFWSFDGSLLEG